MEGKVREVIVLRDWLKRQRGLIAINLLSLAALLPFIAKPFHIDDPMYLWAAQHIRSAPLDPYGFDVNWYGLKQPMAQVMKNPPLVCYWLAGASVLLGWSEMAMHAALLPAALGLASATYLLAVRWSARPTLAAAMTMLAPATLVSSTTVMSDVLMMCFFVWAIYLWARGIDERRMAVLIIACAFATLSALTKYFGISAVLLMAAYAFLKTCRSGAWIAPLLLPIAVLAAYHLWTQRLYGEGLLLSAAEYAISDRWHGVGAILNRFVTGLCFIGGGAIAIALPILLRGSRRGYLFIAAAVIVVVALALLVPTRMPLTYRLQHPFFAGCGGAVLICCTIVAWRDRSPANLTMILWIAGTLAFAIGVNWTVSARTILPLVPAAAMLATRTPAAARPGEWFAPIGVALGAVVALCAAAADYSLARAERAAASEFARRTEGASTSVWFMGHWGFQWYAEGGGLRAIDAGSTVISPGEIILIPLDNTNTFKLPAAAIQKVDELTVWPLSWASTMDRRLGAGFYTDQWGRLPFAFGPASPRRFIIYVATGRITLSNPRMGKL